MLFVAYWSRSSQIASAARLLAISWLFSIQLWLTLIGSALSISYVMLDVILACAFFEMSRNRWFPVPLFFLHAALVLYNLYTALIGSSYVWIASFLNRAFELSILYVIACSAFRIYCLRHGRPAA